MINFRMAKIDEWKKLQQLNDEVFADNYKYDSDLKLDWAKSEAGSKYFQDLVNDSQSCCYVAEDEDTKKLVGYIAASPHNFDYRLSKYLEIDNMGVSPEYRSQGLGSLLIQEVRKWAQDRGFNKLFVNAYSKNISAIEFYRKNGFSDIDVSLETDI